MSAHPIGGPLFNWYGSKWRLGAKYPRPQFGTIVEPFAGGAGYSLRYYDRRVILYDANPMIVGVWRYLIEASPKEILRLPETPSESLSTEARDLVALWSNRSTGGSAGRFNEKARQRVSRAVCLIRHWRAECRDYRDIPEAFGHDSTWFVDPPYQNSCGREYTHQPGDYGELARWCHSLPGQLIACEQDGADYLPFERVAQVRSRPPKRTTIDPAVKSEIVALAGEPHNLSRRKIADRLGLKRAYVFYALKPRPTVGGSYYEVMYHRPVHVDGLHPNRETR